MTEPESELEVEVFRSGDYGAKGSYGEGEMDSLAAGYDPESHEAPVTLDHAQRGPSHGWVKRLRRVGDRLVATLWKLSPSLRDWIRSGAYRKCSVELYRSFRGSGRPYLKAVSFLGAAAPEVKGLQAPLFSESVAEGSSGAANAVAADARPEATAEDSVCLSAADVATLGTDSAPAIAASATAPTQPTSAPTPSAEDARRIVEATFGALKRSGQLLPAWERAGLVEFGELLLSLDDRGGTVSAPGSDTRRTPWQWFLEFLRTLPRQVNFGELAPPDAAEPLAPGNDWTAGVPLPSPRAALCPRSIELHRDAVRFMSEHPGTRYAEALREAARR